MTDPTLDLTGAELERFWSKVDKSSLNGCWLWLGKTQNGYGCFNFGKKLNKRVVRAHRIAYRLTVGPISDGLHLDHVCRVRHCVNPAHLEPVTIAENVRRGAAARATGFCVRGHEVTGEKGRQCRQCASEDYEKRKNQKYLCKHCGKSGSASARSNHIKDMHPEHWVPRLRKTETSAKRLTDQTCSWNGCENQANPYGRLCWTHKGRKERGVDMDGPSPELLFWSHVDQRGVDECWEWQLGRDRDGYGSWGTGRLYGWGERAHRVAYYLHHGGIDDDLELDHLCRNKPCVNPQHLEPVTTRENVLRSNNVAAINARKTHCVRGHEFTPENTQIHCGRRICAICSRAKTRRNRAKRKARANAV